MNFGRKYNNEYISVYESNSVKVPRSAPMMQEFSEEVTYRNYLRLEQTEKVKIYHKQNRFNPNNKQEYYGLTFGTEDSISSGNMHN